ncbi:MAG: Transcriptional regulator [Gaiellaceae bacterium]|nr:Transcriptional regulator [Gaiellaceae bacterium]
MELRVLGSLEVVGEDGVVPLPAAKHRRLLAALALGLGKTCSVDALVDAIWGETPPASSRKLLQVYVSQLRKALPAGAAVVTEPAGYALDLDGGFLDAARFEALLADASGAVRDGNPALAASLAQRALELWRGPAYAEVAYEDFARGEAERLDELRVVASEESLEARLALGRHEEALGEALALARAQPLRERPQRLAMLALYRAGRQTEALDLYATVRERLDAELGLEPSTDLRELQRRILQQDPALDVAAGFQTTGSLPAPPNPLVGRERELDALRALLERRDVRLLVLTGAGGSGKTRLALEAARAAAGSFANGAVLVELAPLRDPELVVPTIAQALDLADAATPDTLADALRTRELLLVLDNAEHLRAAAPLFAELIARVPRLTLLVTSRAVLHVSGEHVFPVEPLGDEAALELFEQRARALAPAFSVVEENGADVREICRRVDGLPLAIELAAARIRVLTPRALVARLSERLSVLTGGPHDLPARQQTLRETIDWSVERLAERERLVLARLAVFRGGATLAAAEVVCDADLDTLTALVDNSLVRRGEAEGEPRFELLETIREYALELLGGERASVELRMGEHLADLLAAVEFEARESAAALERLDPELDNLRAAIDAAVAAGDVELELRLAGGLWRYCWVRGLAVEGLRRIRSALERAGKTPSTARARALQGGAGLAWSLGDFACAKELAREAIPVAAEVGSLWDEIAANTVLGVVANNEDDREAARRHHRRGMELSEQLGLEPLPQKLNLGIVALDSGDYDEARELFEDVLAHHRRAENDAGIGFALINLGVVHHALGDHGASLEAFREAGERFERVGFRVHVAHALQGLAAFEASEGRFREAARLLGRARAELDEVGAAETDFAADMVGWTKGRAAEALGPEGFEAAYEAARSGVAGESPSGSRNLASPRSDGRRR